MEHWPEYYFQSVENNFQSPLHRECTCNFFTEPRSKKFSSFSPLFIGGAPGTQRERDAAVAAFTFSPLFIGGAPGTKLDEIGRVMHESLSVPSSSGVLLEPHGLASKTLNLTRSARLLFSQALFLRGAPSGLRRPRNPKTLAQNGSLSKIVTSPVTGER